MTSLPRPYPMPVLLTIVALLLLSVIFVPRVYAQQTLENPQPDSFQSGVGVISGWACNAQTIEISFNGGPPQEAGYGTSRGDTQAVCGDSDNGFGLLYNWNLLGDGPHTVTAYADGVEFATVTVIVTTLGEEFLRGASVTFPLADFPTPGARRTLRWQEAQQNFVITAGSPQGGGSSGAAPHVLENPAPGSFQSGIGLISGWVCAAQTITIRFDGGPPQEAAYGTSRGDTEGACGDTDNGFGLLYNWNLLGDGPHTVAASADGVEFARVEVTVTTLGGEFQRGLSHEVRLTDFPEVGSDIVLRWQQARQNFVISYAAPTQRLVDVTPTLTLPAGVTAVQRPEVRVTALGSEAAAVRASPEPSLLFAEDADGTVLLALADMDGGLLGEATGEVEVSIASTAIVLVALAAGYAIPDIDQAVVDEIVARAQYPALLAALTQLMVADKNFLDRLFAHPEVVALIREVAAFRAAPAAQGLSFHTAAVRMDGIIRDDFGADSPWADDAPWQWFGTANRFFLPVQPPFLAQSKASDLQAAANPNFVDYALRAYTGDAFHDWYHTPRNADQIDKLLNSGAAQRLLRLAPEINRVVFTRYRWTLEDAPLGPAYSFLNTFKMVTSVVSLMRNVKAVQRWLEGLPPTAVPAIAACGVELVTAVRLSVPTSGSVGIREVRVILDNAIRLNRALIGCAADPLIDEFKTRVRKALTEGVLADLAKKLAGPLSWILLAYEALNETTPVLTSYFAPSAGDAEYYLGWAVSEAGVPYLACVSEDDTCPPPAPANLRVTRQPAGTVTVAWDAVPAATTYTMTILREDRPEERCEFTTRDTQIEVQDFVQSLSDEIIGPYEIQVFGTTEAGRDSAELTTSYIHEYESGERCDAEVAACAARCAATWEEFTVLISDECFLYTPPTAEDCYDYICDELSCLYG